VPERGDHVAPPLWRHLLAVLALPFVAVVVVPLLIADAELAAAPLAALGAVLIPCGLALFVWTVTLFARIGRGTLAPWDPTKRLVVAGPYRYVRNPMITAVGTILLGEAALLGSVPILVWVGVFFAVNSAWFVLVEEPKLRERFGEEYAEYARATPRWLPVRGLAE
jgi:protein-S-isoprenylcysteine O-methyltransferase Ste14